MESGVKATCTPPLGSTPMVGCDVGRSILGIGTMKKLPEVATLPTVTIVLALVEPYAFVATKVYSVVAAGLTCLLDPVTVPMPGVMLRLVAPVTLQLNVLEPPGAILAGLALKLVMTGGLPAGDRVMNGRNT